MKNLVVLSKPHEDENIGNWKSLHKNKVSCKTVCLFQFQSEMETRNDRPSLDISEPLYRDSSKREILKWN